MPITSNHVNHENKLVKEIHSSTQLLPYPASFSKVTAGWVGIHKLNQMENL